MTLSLGEFQRTVALLAGHRLAADERSVELAVAEGLVAISYEPLAPQRFGGLLELPRGRVTLAFDGVSEQAAQGFVRRFDFVFQRGGG